MRRHPASRQSQQGFTLVEIAVVLVIIGLLLGGVLKGQELINSARVKALSQDLRNIPTMLYGYQDRFRTLPGDDAQAVNHLGATALNGNGNGLIEGDWDTNEADKETCKFWQHLRLGNFLAGSTALTAGGDCGIQPHNSVGGILGIEVANSTHTAFIAGMRGTYLCSSGIQGRYVRQLDQTMDDGDPAAGSLRAVTVGSARGSAAVALNTLDDESTYTICLEI
ncbi:prepilin-type N-terminal cleavage/methylation domain-containing protein [Nitrogeniibacter mangrovi]|uniref:Prepilin-type N-terminal cleavage/methylation domain-containing protein n=1 Tax=Nitrogeniibacter mangrovi TaxID=2016596 RepID=A0A6C1B7U9_9RHOO|nr:prepilin-type N-terminal cleavage/methylation domain-containing protein [Nitrogeniibacter mangrovi]QID18798.1 prepilin-type N-terminal cleavage/methylation domain-containing protein [Nitrogeniibacter mangrovi]